MYFEGCLSFNVIQQGDLMSRVFVGSLPITLDYGSSKCFHYAGPLSFDLNMDYRIFTTAALSPV